MELFSSEHWKDYELIDTGGLEKLERFGKYTFTRQSDILQDSRGPCHHLTQQSRRLA